MGTVTYLAKKGSYTVDKYTFAAGKVVENVDEKVIDYLKNDPELSTRFSFDGVQGKPLPAKAKQALYGGTIVDEPTTPTLPVKGFKTKHDAIAFAKGTLDLDLPESIALKTMNNQIIDAYNAKFHGAAAGGDGVEDIDTAGAVAV